MMDPRKTVVIADFDAVVRSASEPSAAPLSAAGVQPAVPQWGVETLTWPSGGEAKDVAPPERTSDVRQTLARGARTAQGTPNVLIGRTVLARGEPRSVSLAKTQVWRREVTVSEDVTGGERARAQVHVDEAVMQHLSAEVWAGQAPSGPHILLMTVRRSIVDVSTSLVELHPHEAPPATIAGADRITKLDAGANTDALARCADDELIRIPRLFRMPEAKTIRIACLALCIASAGALAIYVKLAGFAERKEPLLSFEGREGDLYRIRVRLAGEDPRIALRQQQLTAAEREVVAKRLQRMDAASELGPWTHQYLELIEARPAQRAPELAELLGLTTKPFKLRVRRLKELGLTESLRVGYRLSPRGESYLRGAREAAVSGKSAARRNDGP